MLSTAEQVRLWSDGRMSLNDMVALLASMGYDSTEVVTEWCRLAEEEGYTVRCARVNRTLSSRTESGEYEEATFDEPILSPPRT